jgi:hypothetical protein
MMKDGGLLLDREAATATTAEGDYKMARKKQDAANGYVAVGVVVGSVGGEDEVEQKLSLKKGAEAQGWHDGGAVVAAAAAASGSGSGSSCQHYYAAIRRAQWGMNQRLARSLCFITISV